MHPSTERSEVSEPPRERGQAIGPGRTEQAEAEAEDETEETQQETSSCTLWPWRRCELLADIADKDAVPGLQVHMSTCSLVHMFTGSVHDFTVNGLG